MESLTRKELKQYLDAYRKIFPVVRIMDANGVHYSSLDDSGMLLPMSAPCYNLWEKTRPCRNCISRNALASCSQHKKFEVFDDEIYQLIASYIEIDGKPHVLELIDKVGENYTHMEEDHKLLSNLVSPNEKLYIDTQTGIYNRKYFEDQLFRLTNVTAVAMIDIDSFRNINDVYGTDGGDAAIREFVSAVRGCVRISDVMIRYGGDEFLLLFQGMSVEVFGRKLTEIQKTVSRITVPECPGLEVSATIGGYYCGQYVKNSIEIADRIMCEARSTRAHVIVRYNEQYCHEGQPEGPAQDSPKARPRTSFSGKRSVLIVEDSSLNRLVLTSLLGDSYNVLTAENGREGLELLSRHYDEIAVVLLDVYMPVCNGFEFLERLRDDAFLSSVPVIVTTGSGDTGDEIRCLELGASDFITKPYNPQVVLGRIRNIIKLRDSVAALSAVEFDSLTGLYTIQAFYHHAAKRLRASSGQYDLVVSDLKDFKIVNSVFGKSKGDDVLAYLGRRCRLFMGSGLAARSGDRFFVLLPAEKRMKDEDWEAFREESVSNAPVPGLNIKYGYYPDVEKSKPVSLLCNRALMAVSSIKQDYTQSVCTYNEQINNRLLRNQEMESCFEDALKAEEFVVWYQPKVDCRTQEIMGGEALVRWMRKDGSMVSPGEFIPLFEQDGLIHRLDRYVFQNVCLFQKRRMEAGKKVLPVSVNLSRNSLHHRGIIDTYGEIMKNIGVPAALVPIELTESAATGSHLLIDLAERMAREGFVLHMDDFGSGYSSLSMLSLFPLSELKLDKALIDMIGSERERSYCGTPSAWRTIWGSQWWRKVWSMRRRCTSCAGPAAT